ncbi:MAG: metallophosphoesterase [Bacteroidetes bacterium]|nr:metallophosphoesterase [Bacteroidota bacterium]
MTQKNSKESKTTKSHFFGGISGGLLKAAVTVMIVLTAAVMPAMAQTFTWKINSGDANVSRIGTNNHVLKLENLKFDKGNLSDAGGTLNITYAADKNAGSQRRIVAWTDLSGDIGDIEDFTFASPANQTAGKVVRIDPRLEPADNFGSISIPLALLYDGTNLATTMYVIITTDAGGQAYDVLGNQRGGGTNLDFNKLDKIELIIPEPASRLTWKTFPAGDDSNVSYMGSPGGASGSIPGQVLKLDNIKFDAENLPIIGGVLRLPFRTAYNTSRRILVWTDLSGNAPEIEDYSFATQANMAAGKIAISSLITSGGTDSEINIPQNMIYNASTNTYATAIYILITVDKGGDPTDDYTVAINQRGGDARNNVNGVNLAKEFEIFESITLSIPEPSQFASHITITPGANASEMNFAWFTKAGTANAAVLQLMPLTSEEQLFTGVNATGVHGFSTNKVTVTGLAKNTEYKYRVGDGNAENWSKIYTFKTYDPNAKYSVIAVGDPQIGSSGDRGQWLKTVPAAVAQAEKTGGGPAFMLIAGDQTNYSNDIDELESYLSPAELKKLPVAVTIGNHDVVDIRVGIDPDGFMDKVYNWPNHSDLKDTDADTSRLRAGGNYYFQYGNTLYISINSQITKTEFHEEFMEQAIASYPDATWKIALFHHNIYGGGSHASPKGYADSYNMQATWSPFLDKYGIDLTINGHDHVYARSRFMQGNEIMKYQMPTVLDIDETNAIKANPGTFIQPKGIQYMALSGATAKFYALEMQPWVAYGHEQDNKAQYSIMSVDGKSLTFSTYRAEDDALIDVITIKKMADFADLQSLIPGMKSVPENNITQATWDAFQQKITEAEAITATSPAADIHAMYIALYDAYYALDPNTDKTALGSLIETVTAKLAVSSEGRWEGQFPFGSKAEVQKVLDAAVIVYDLRLATQENIDEAFENLDKIYQEFLSKESTEPCPFIYVHDIKADAPYAIDLIDWMFDGVVFFYGADDKEHYNAHFTKQVYAKDNADAWRSEDRYGPVNIKGGRGHNEAHITQTYIGEWIRYELNVEKAGAYKATLGAANSTSSKQTVVLRDAKQNILSTFVIEPNTPLVDQNWESAESYEGDKEFYLPAGKCIIELFFVNEGVGVDGSATANNYKAGADVDILILERTGDMTPPAVVRDPSIFPLPFVPTATAGAVNRQRGWSTTGHVCEDSGFVGKDLPVGVLRTATHLVMELAGPPSSSTSRSVQINILTESIDWSQAEPLLNGANGIFKSDIGPFGALVFDFEKLDFTQGGNVFQRLKTMNERGRIIIGYFSYGWEELNVMKSYLKTTFVEVTNITGVPTEATAEIPLTLSGTVTPSNASNQTITWSVKDAGTTGATITDNTLNTTAAGTVIVTATIVYGTATDTPYTQDFTITVSEPTSITGVTAANPLQAWANNGVLYVTGLTAGELLSIYSASGALVHSSIATGTQANVPLKTQGVYFVKAGTRTVRVVSYQ